MHLQPSSEQVLRGLKWTACLVYLDDIIIFSKTIGDHLQHLAEVFSRLRDARLKIKTGKCHLLQERVHYLSHVISQLLWPWSTPTSCKQLRQFVKGFTHLASSPLFKFTENKNRQWKEECNQAFLQLKHQLTSTPILALLNIDKLFMLDVDASILQHQSLPCNWLGATSPIKSKLLNRKTPACWQ